MRVTNSMTVNNLILNLNRGMSRLDKSQYQASTGNKIQFASDDPIVAGRALKFRTNVAEAEQYISNVAQGRSWMETTEGAFNNVEEVMQRIKELCVQAATDTYTLEDRQKIVREIMELRNELTSDINVTYAGRYTFSGYRTDEPPLFALPNDRIFNITQTFSNNDIHNTTTILTDPSDELKALNVPIGTAAITRMILPYDSIDGDGAEDTDCPIALKIAPTAVIVNEDGEIEEGETTELSGTMKTSTDEDAYNPPPEEGEFFYIRDTGEIILPTGFTLSVGTQLVADYSKSSFIPNDPNPTVYFTCSEQTSEQDEDGEYIMRNYSMNDQAIKYELGINNRVQINNLAKDSLTPAMLADLREVVAFTNKFAELAEMDLEAAGVVDIEAITTAADQFFRDAFHGRFSDMLVRVELHKSQLSKEHTDLGSRMNRVEFIENRLKDDRLNYMSLRDDNEKVDMAETLINLNAQTAAYQAALQVGGNIIQKTLIDFVS